MPIILKKPFPATTWVYLFVFVHLVAWTLIPALTRYNLPLDAIEGSLWGHQFEWGYDKNPYLNGWLTALGGQSEWLIYCFSQLSVAACMLAVYRLGCRLLTPIAALIAVFLLEGIQYYNFHAIDFNDNTLELGLWGLGIYTFYLSMRERKQWQYQWCYWGCTGIFTGLGMMAKYYTAALLAGMFCFMLSGRDERRILTTPAPYIGLLLFLFVTLPHIMWLFTHDFITVKYVFARGSSSAHWSNHLFFPAQFAWQQLEVFLPALALFLLFFSTSKKSSYATKLNTFNNRFLFWVGLGPFLLTLALSCALGTYLRAGWGMPLMSLWGMMLVAYLPANITLPRLYAFITSVFVLLAVLLSGYRAALLDANTPSSANFPGRDIAATITQLWQHTYHNKLIYVAGSRWIGGNIAYYSPDHPSVFVEWKHDRAPWIDINTLRKQGAVFIWDISENETLPAEVARQFPTLTANSVMQFHWKRDTHHLAPIKLGIALLPPT